MIDIGINNKKEQLRNEIAIQTINYLNNGGEIKDIPMGKMKYPDRFVSFNTDSESISNMEKYFAPKN